MTDPFVSRLNQTFLLVFVCLCLLSKVKAVQYCLTEPAASAMPANLGPKLYDTCTFQQAAPADGVRDAMVDPVVVSSDGWKAIFSGCNNRIKCSDLFGTRGKDGGDLSWLSKDCKNGGAFQHLDYNQKPCGILAAYPIVKKT
ncbi:MAG: hypothetical protein M1837_005231 [Sclerophora amabilis]|nr:MAG: hypothetical protein M1837_005231 [Sclerophora amabilis]